VRIVVHAFKEFPVLNPCFVLRDWKGGQRACVEINGERISDRGNCRQGIVRDTKGDRQLVIWLDFDSQKSTRFDIRK
jgi:hypothetical protein